MKKRQNCHNIGMDKIIYTKVKIENRNFIFSLGTETNSLSITARHCGGHKQEGDAVEDRIN